MQLKPQTIRAGKFTLEFVQMSAAGGNSILIVRDGVHGQRITFNSAGDALTIETVPVNGDPVRVNPHAPPGTNEQAASEAAEREKHNSSIDPTSSVG